MSSLDSHTQKVQSGASFPLDQRCEIQFYIAEIVRNNIRIICFFSQAIDCHSHLRHPMCNTLPSQVQKYVQMFAEKMDLMKLIRFETTLVEFQAREDHQKGSGKFQ